MHMYNHNNNNVYIYIYNVLNYPQVRIAFHVECNAMSQCCVACSGTEQRSTPDLRTITEILDFRGFDSSRISSLRDGILMSIGNCPESLSQQIFVGMILVGRWGVPKPVRRVSRAHRAAAGTRQDVPSCVGRCFDARTKIPCNN